MTAPPSAADGAPDDQRLRALLARHAPTTPGVRERLGHAGHAGDQAGAAIGVLRKADLAALQAARPPDGGLFSDGFEPEALFFSPGGILEPRVPRAVERLAELLGACGFAAGDRVLNGFNYHFTPAGLLFHEALARLGCCVLPAGPQNLELQAQFALRAGANGFVGIASHLHLLLGHPAAAGLKIRIAMAGAEPLAEDIRAQLSSRHGVACFDLYGFAEGGIIARGCAQGPGLHLHADAIAEVIDPQSDVPLAEGEAGELVISLDNPGFPLLRFGTGDLVRLSAARCACGEPYSLQLLGRCGNSVRVKGMLLHEAQLREFAQAAGVRGCEVVVQRDDQQRDRLALSVSSAPALGEQETQQAFRSSCRLKPDFFRVNAELAAGSFRIIDARRPEAAQ